MGVKRVAVIGAGAAGLAAARRLVEDPEHFHCTVFEQTGSVGGTWVYSDRVGTDEFGLPVHSSMYKTLRTNLPKEVMGYPDFPVPECEGQGGSYVPAAHILQFFNDFADHYGVRERVRFYHCVRSVVPRPGGGWAVTTTDLRAKRDATEDFDAVMVCNGHFSKPFMPTVAGTEGFKGRIMHSHDFRSPEEFKGLNVVFVGARASGMDICLQTARAGAASAVLSHHWPEALTTPFPANVRQAPDVARLSERGVVFTDGSESACDVLCFCTGYLYTFPFLGDLVRVEDNHVRPLYKHLVHTDYPTLALIGLPFYVCANSLFDLQSRFFLRTLTGQVRLPEREEMRADSQRDFEQRLAKGLKSRHAHMMGPMQNDYYLELADLARVEPLPPVLAKMHGESARRFLEDFVNYRDDVYKVVDEHNFVRAVPAAN